MCGSAISACGLGGKEPDEEKNGKDRDAVELGEWFGDVTFQSTVGTVYSAPAATEIHPFTRELSCSSHWLCTNRLLGSLR